MSAHWVDHSFAPHMHDFYAVSLNYAGRGVFDCRNELRHATPGTCNLIAPGVIHTGRATARDGWSYRNLNIEQQFMTRLLEGVDWRGAPEVRFKLPSVNDPVLATQLANVFASFDEESSLLQHESLLLSVVARLVTDHFVSGRALGAAGREHVGVDRVRSWLEANAEQNVSIRQLSALAGLSAFHLIRAFRKRVGLPPHRYQTVVRVNRARRLLRSGAPISAVAYRTGFCDQSHLNRCFKQILGVTPGKYATRARDRT